MLRRLLIAAALVGFAAPVIACSGAISAARFDQPTDRYPHGVLGDKFEWGQLRLTCGGDRVAITLPVELVFEDVAPRLADLDGDGRGEVVVVESHRDKGARLAIWGNKGGNVERIAATPFIGTRFRWLAPVGIADLDGDGAMELAYVDRPHLARILRVWRFADGKLTETASAQGFSNHRIGETGISGGIRTCAGRPEMVVASADWSRIQAVRLTDGRLEARDVGPFTGQGAFKSAMRCQ